MKKLTFNNLVKLLKPEQVIRKSFYRCPDRFSMDSRELKNNEAFIAIKGSLFDGHCFIKEAVSKGASLIISEEKKYCDNLNACFFIVKDTFSSLGTISRHLRESENPKTIAITGSVGKTTTKEMLSCLLGNKFNVLKNKKSENNFLGVCKTLLRLEKQNCLILELGTNSSGEIGGLTDICKPDLGIITFIKPVHTERLPRLKDILKEKIKLLSKNRDVIGILNRDDSLLKNVKLKNRIFWFGKAKESHVFAKFVSSSQRESVFLVNNKYILRLKTPAYFFIYNALGAILTATLLGVDLDFCVEGLQSFTAFPPMRMQRKVKKGTIFINDAYNSNPFSLREALGVVAAIPQPKIAVIGDMLELGKKSVYYHKIMAREINKCNFDYVLTIGEYSLFLKKKLVELGCKTVFHFDSHKAIVHFLKEITRIKKYLILLKGSRGMELEKIIEKF